eukprot:SAG31_NODE_17040_length_685_cov_2.126280_1_plen_95_part_10
MYIDHIGGPLPALRSLLHQLEKVPDLRVVINHMAQPGPFTDGACPAPSAEWTETMYEAARFQNVFMKVSAVFEAAPSSGPAPTTLEYYRPHLDVL